MIVSVMEPLFILVRIESGVVRRYIDLLRAQYNSQVEAGEDIFIDDPNEVTSGPSATTKASPSSSQDGAVPTPNLPYSGPCIQTPPELHPSIPQPPQATAASDSANGIPVGHQFPKWGNHRG